MKLFLGIGMVLLIVFLGAQLLRLRGEANTAEDALKTAHLELGKLETENEQLEADISYFAEPENLSKELRARFDYKKPGEKMIKIQ